jgi:hypothetical protein
MWKNVKLKCFGWEDVEYIQLDQSMHLQNMEKSYSYQPCLSGESRHLIAPTLSF